MKALYVRRLFLWPRYQGAVKDSLEKNECEVTLLSLEPSHCLPCCFAVCSAVLLDLHMITAGTLTCLLWPKPQAQSKSQ